MRFRSYVANILNYLRVHAFARRKGFQTQSMYISTKADFGVGIRLGKNVIIDENVTVGDYSYVNRNSSLECCTIGKYCSISEGVKINPVEHNNKLISTHPFVGDNGHYGMTRRTVTIGNDVLISMNVIILGGVNIGDGAIIGAGAVVTHDVLPYEIVGGIPAHHIKYRFDNAKIQYLEELCWWDWPNDRILRNLAFFRNETDNIVK